MTVVEHYCPYVRRTVKLEATVKPDSEHPTLAWLKFTECLVMQKHGCVGYRRKDCCLNWGEAYTVLEKEVEA